MSKNMMIMTKETELEKQQQLTSTQNGTYSLPCGKLNQYVHVLLDMKASPADEEKNVQYLKTVLGGYLNIASSLGVDLSVGLQDEQVEEMKCYGRNDSADPPMKPFSAFFFEELCDPILLTLIGAAVTLIVLHGSLGNFGGGGFVEGAAIIVAVLIVVLFCSINNYSKELKFRAVEKMNSSTQNTSVLRGNRLHVIPVAEVVLDDVVVLRAGDQIPADGILFEGNEILCDESMLTGESGKIKKDDKGFHPFLFSSCLISEMNRSKTGNMLVTAVGDNCEWGRIRSTISNAPAPVDTPLQKKLKVLCKYIGIAAVLFATAMYILVFLRSLRDYLSGAISQDELIDDALHQFIEAVSVVIVAIPEGLPLAITISLAYCTINMYKDKILIRRLSACETMGNATAIFTDKTGTLTANQLVVAEGQYEVVLLALYSKACLASSCMLVYILYTC